MKPATKEDYVFRMIVVVVNDVTLKTKNASRTFLNTSHRSKKINLYSERSWSFQSFSNICFK